LARLLGCNLITGNLIVAMHLDDELWRNLAKSLDKVPSKRIVIVNQQQHGKDQTRGMDESKARTSREA
jgi:hypothetical protein